MLLGSGDGEDAALSLSARYRKPERRKRSARPCSAGVASSAWH